MQKEYIDAVLHEAKLRRGYINNNERARTLYIGGGTPSTLSLLNFEHLIHGIGESLPFLDINKLDEFTVECNPDDITNERIALFQSFGVNRISIGVQTFSDERLQFLKRRHNSSQISSAVETIRHGGIKNISIDLMFGFPGETLKEWEDDIKRAVSLDVEHLSAYSLMYEEGTPLFRMLNEGFIQELPEEYSVKMYDVLIDRLEAEGYEHYEISNFAKTGHRSVHNSSYWNDEPYLGLGAAAHSYNTKQRHNNVCNIKEYIYSLGKGIIPCETETIDETTHYNDLVTTALRRKEGIFLEYIDEPYRSYLLKMSRKGIGNGTLREDGKRIMLTRKGLYVSDDVMSDLIWL